MTSTPSHMTSTPIVHISQCILLFALSLQYDAKGAGFNYGMPPMGGSASAYGYMHSYGHVMPVPPGDGSGLGARQHQSSKHGRGGFPSTSWGQGT